MIDCQRQLIFLLGPKQNAWNFVVVEGYLIEPAGGAYFFTGSDQYCYKFDGVLKALVRIFRSEKKKLDIGN